MKYFAPRSRINGYGIRKTRRETYNSTSSSTTERNAWWPIRDEVWERDGGRCIFCKTRVRDAARDVHHIVPLSRGGTNTKANMGCICMACHDKRHPKQGLFAKVVAADPF